MSKILIVEDKKNLRIALSNFLKENDFVVSETDGVETAKNILDREFFQAAVIDIRLSDGNGLEILDFIRNSKKDLIVIMMSAYGDIPVAVSAIKKGAKDFVTKPFEPMELLQILQREISLSAVGKENPMEMSETVGTSKLWLDVLKLARDVAKIDSTVLISGETGSGKEVVARYIHLNSKRAKAPFIPVNCAALPKELVESELFGAEAGAYTGAERARTGKFESAHGGTIFLDEIGDLSDEAQAKILRILETKKVQRLGSSTPIEVDTRIISATNKNLSEEIKRGRFREDLFYRISVFPIEVPPLRDRPEDISSIAKYLIGKIASKLERDFDDEIPSPVLDRLVSHDWPGNVRELSNVMERAMILSGGRVIDPEKIFIPEKERESDIHRAVMDREREIIVKALKKTGWNRTEAAKTLGISYRSLLEKIKKYKIVKKT
ncbi:sigma-54-dependent Fis family transcriptional regulator [candidate division WOR-3 bacterium]|nr:sigma-54-dependent Fis family transcriptional regulator [candidate division WOR-3 bacterium]